MIIKNWGIFNKRREPFLISGVSGIFINLLCNKTEDDKFVDEVISGIFLGRIFIVDQELIGLEVAAPF